MFGKFDLEKYAYYESVFNELLCLKLNKKYEQNGFAFVAIGLFITIQLTFGWTTILTWDDYTMTIANNFE